MQLKLPMRRPNNPRGLSNTHASIFTIMPHTDSPHCMRSKARTLELSAAFLQYVKRCPHVMESVQARAVIKHGFEPQISGHPRGFDLRQCFLDFQLCAGPGP